MLWLSNTLFFGTHVNQNMYDVYFIYATITSQMTALAFFLLSEINLTSNEFRFYKKKKK